MQPILIGIKRSVACDGSLTLLHGYLPFSHSDTYTLLHTYSHTHTFTHTHSLSHTDTDTDTHTHTHRHTHTHTYTHCTHTHTHIHTNCEIYKLITPPWVLIRHSLTDIQADYPTLSAGSEHVHSVLTAHCSLKVKQVGWDLEAWKPPSKYFSILYTLA